MTRTQNTRSSGTMRWREEHGDVKPIRCFVLFLQFGLLVTNITHVFVWLYQAYVQKCPQPTGNFGVEGLGLRHRSDVDACPLIVCPGTGKHRLVFQTDMDLCRFPGPKCRRTNRPRSASLAYSAAAPIAPEASCVCPDLQLRYHYDDDY